MKTACLSRIFQLYTKRMAYTYIIDGYNLLYAMEDVPAGAWEERRAALVRWLELRKPQGRNALRVVFDSRQGSGDRMRQGDVDIVYTSGQTADEWIADHVRAVGNPRLLVVVSNDKGIRTLVRGTGAKWMSASEFLAEKRRPRETSGAAKRVHDEEAITHEFIQRWL